jgi:hypothetical protein
MSRSRPKIWMRLVSGEAVGTEEGLRHDFKCQQEVVGQEDLGGCGSGSDGG